LKLVNFTRFCSAGVISCLAGSNTKFCSRTRSEFDTTRSWLSDTLSEVPYRQLWKV